LCESAPDPFIRYTYPNLLDESRAAVAKVLNAPVEGVVFVPNATTGVNTVLGNIFWNNGDEILYFRYATFKPINQILQLSHNLPPATSQSEVIMFELFSIIK